MHERIALIAGERIASGPILLERATLLGMNTPLKGLVHDNTVVLDETVPPSEGKRVLVVLEAVDETELDQEQNRQAWTAWVSSGPQGPIEDEDEPAFP